MKYLITVLMMLTMIGCNDRTPTADSIEAAQTAKMAKEAAMKVGPPRS